jgi:hypothetical protein
MWNVWSGLLGHAYEVPAGLLVAAGVFAFMRHRLPPIAPVSAAALALGVAGLAVLGVNIVAAAAFGIPATCIVPLSPAWFWLAALACGVVALASHASGAPCAIAGLAVALLGLGLYALVAVCLARHPW